MFSIFHIFSYGANSMLPWLSALVIISVALCDEDSDYIPKTYCSQNLNDMLALVCDNKFNGLPVAATDGHSIQSRSVPDTAIGHLSFRRIRRALGIVEECCKNKCGVKQLKRYCGR